MAIPIYEVLPYLVNVTDTIVAIYMYVHTGNHCAFVFRGNHHSNM